MVITAGINHIRCPYPPPPSPPPPLPLTPLLSISDMQLARWRQVAPACCWDVTLAECCSLSPELPGSCVQCSSPAEDTHPWTTTPTSGSHCEYLIVISQVLAILQYNRFISTLGPFKCYVTLFFWKVDPHPPPRNANNIEHYTFVTIFSRKSDTPPSALRNT